MNSTIMNVGGRRTIPKLSLWAVCNADRLSFFFYSHFTCQMRSVYIVQMSVRNTSDLCRRAASKIYRSIIVRLLFGTCLCLQTAIPARAWQVQPAPNQRQGTSTGGYAGSESCAPCHQSIYRRYMQSDMGKSMLAATPSNLTQNFLQHISVPAHSFNEQTARHFDTFVQDGKLYQSEYQTAADGSDIFPATRHL